jgi:signal transduction histidine kinase
VRPQNGTEQFERLQQITDAALAHLQLDELLGAILLRTRAGLEADTCAILLLDETTNELVARAAVGIEEEVEAGVRIPVGKGFAGRIAADRRPVILDDVDHSDVLNPILRQKGIKSMVGVPLLIEGEVLGVLHVGSLTPRDFQASDVEFLQLAADRIAMAIDHARLFEAERLARQRLENVQAVTDVALAHLEVEELLGELLVRVRQILQTHTAAILLLDEETDELVARSALGIEEEVEQGVRIPLGGGFAGKIAAEKRPVILPVVDEDHVLNPILIQKGIKSMLGVPLLRGGDAIGVLHVGSLVPREFTTDDVELLTLVADRAALAIDRARVIEDILRLDQLKLNFVAVASHELRTPATAVFGALATLRAHGPTLSPETRSELEETLWQQANRLTRLIEQLLDLSRLDDQAIELDPQPVVLRSVLDEVARTALPDAFEAIRVDVDDELAAVVDRVAVERVVSNLLVNAARYGRAPIVIRAENRDRHLRIAVDDAGAGVPPELVPRLFERFERGLDGAGSGLGLAIAKALAEAHGGVLHVESEPGLGARFRAELPLDRTTIETISHDELLFAASA